VFEIVFRYDAERCRATHMPACAADACRRLEDGNRDFAHLFDTVPLVRGSVRRLVPFDPRDLGFTEVEGMAPKQHPFAIVLGCSDARVPTELIFNKWCNELFVVRVAGNVLGADTLGSIDYAVSQLRESVKLMVVLGHSGCGAVTAAVDVFLKPAQYLAFATSHPLRTIIDRVVVVVRGAARALELAHGADVSHQVGYRRALIEITVAMNAALTAHTLEQELRRSPGTAPIATVYGVYDLATRRVNVPGMAQPGAGEADVSLQAPPADIDAFAALARRLAATDGVRTLLAAA